MPAVVLVALKFVFLALVYLLVWRVATAVAEQVGPLRRRNRSSTATGLTVVRSETQRGMVVEVSETVTLGRGEDADVLLEDAYASQMHARLAREEGALTLEDLGSSSGTYVNGKRVIAIVTLGEGDAIQIGKTVLEVR